MIYGVCIVCGGDKCRCDLSRVRSRVERSSMQKAISKHISGDAIVVGDPTNFRSSDVDYGWDIESDGALIDDSALISR